MLFADAGFDCEELVEECFKLGYKNNKNRGNTIKLPEDIDDKLYRKFRG